MKLSEEQRRYSQKGKRYRDTVDDVYWDIIIQGVRLHSDGSRLWLDILSKKKGYNRWIEDGTDLNGFISDIKSGKIEEVFN